VVGHLLAVQAQDERALALALRARGSGFGFSDVGASRGLVVGWLMRGTLHLVCVEDWWWLWTLTARRVGPGDAAGRLVAEVLAGEGPLVRAALLERLAAKGLVLEGQAFPHLLADCCARGEVVLTPARAFVLAVDWVGPRVEVDRGDALRSLGARYAAAHAGAGPEDLAAWSGLGLRAARAALAGVGSRDAPADHAPPADVGVVVLAGREHLRQPRLLPAFDPYLLGWKDRAFAVPAALKRRAFPGGGMLRAVTLADGLVTGTWTAPGGRVQLDTPDPDAFAREAADVERFLRT
jgi:hypothetical protein